MQVTYTERGNGVQMTFYAPPNHMHLGSSYVYPLGLRKCLQDLTEGNREWAQWWVFVILQNKSMSASSAIASIVYSLLQKPYLKACLRKELTWLFSLAERKPLHAGMVYRILDSTSASNTVCILIAESFWCIKPTVVPHVQNATYFRRKVRAL